MGNRFAYSPLTTIASVSQLSMIRRAGEYDRASERRDGGLRPEADAAPDVVDKPPFLNEAAISCSFAHFVEC
jgi:hypothetical protein